MLVSLSATLWTPWHFASLITSLSVNRLTQLLFKATYPGLSLMLGGKVREGGPAPWLGYTASNQFLRDTIRRGCGMNMSLCRSLSVNELASGHNWCYSHGSPRGTGYRPTERLAARWKPMVINFGSPALLITRTLWWLVFVFSDM